MSFADKLLHIERIFERGLATVAGRSQGPRETFEIASSIVEEIAAHVEPAGAGARVFPYNRVAVRLVVPRGKLQAARAVLDHGPGLDARLRRRLEEAGCKPPIDVRVTVRIAEGAPPHGREFELELAGRPAAAPAPAEGAAVRPRVRLAVLTGDAGERTRLYAFERIQVGRLPSVTDHRRRTVRLNDLAFAEGDDPVNATVSRAHAHIEWVQVENGFRLFDDGSAQGTRIERDRRVVDVPRRSAHGVLLRSGDVLCFGRARVRFTVEG